MFSKNQLVNVNTFNDLIDAHMKSMRHMMKNFWNNGLIFNDSNDMNFNDMNFNDINFNDINFNDYTDFSVVNGEYICNIDIPIEMIHDIKIIEKNGLLSISAEHTTENTSENTKTPPTNKTSDKNDVLTFSKSYSSYHRILTIPIDGVKDSAIAKYINGKLEIHVKIDANKREHRNITVDLNN